MSFSKNFFNTLRVFVVIVGITSLTESNALTLGDLIGAVMQPQSQAAQPSSGLSSGLKPGAAPRVKEEPLLWQSKADFLNATRNGDLRAIRTIEFRSAEFTPVATSIAFILKTEYGITLPFEQLDPNKVSAQDNDQSSCISTFRDNLRDILAAVADMNTRTLTATPPDFYINPSSQYVHEVEVYVEVIQRVDTCSLPFLGVRKPHPYKAALLKLMDEYGQATKDYVETERTRRKTAYMNTQAQKQAEQKTRDDARAKLDADAKAAEQQRIRDENARIQSEQKMRDEINKNRVGG